MESNYCNCFCEICRDGKNIEFIIIHCTGQSMNDITTKCIALFASKRSEQQFKETRHFMSGAHVVFIIYLNDSEKFLVIGRVKFIISNLIFSVGVVGRGWGGSEVKHHCTKGLQIFRFPYLYNVGNVDIFILLHSEE